MKHWFMRRIALLVALSMLLSTAGIAMAEETAPEEGEYVDIIDYEDGEADAEAIPDELELSDLGELALYDEDAEPAEVGEETLNALEETAGEAEASDAALLTVYAETEAVAESAASGAAEDNDALFEAYLRQVLPGFTKARRRTLASALSGRRSLTVEGMENTLKLYDLLKVKLQAVAKGEETATSYKFTANDIGGFSNQWWTAEDLGLDDLSLDTREEQAQFANALDRKEGVFKDELLYALLADLP